MGGTTAKREWLEVTVRQARQNRLSFTPFLHSLPTIKAQRNQVSSPGEPPQVGTASPRPRCIKTMRPPLTHPTQLFYKYEMHPNLNKSFTKWRSDYPEVEQVQSPINPDKTGFRIKPKGVIVSSPPNTTQDVKLFLNEWLNAGDSDWQKIRDNLISIGSQFKLAEEETRVLLDCQDIKLGCFPWQEWQLFEDHLSQVEIALRVRGRPEDKIIPAQPCSKVIILLVVGRSDNINTNADLNVIQELEEKGAEVICLMQPSIRELCHALWDKQGYHIFIFTGHSGSDQDGQIGWIELNNQDSLSIEDFKNSLKASIDKGLQLAIFNYCDGLGLANQLGKLNLPRTDDFNQKVSFMPTTTQAVRKVAETKGGIYYASAPEIVTQCKVKPLPLSLSNTSPFITPYQAPLIPTENCPEQGRNQLNSDAFKTNKYPINRRLFVIIKQDGSVDEQAGETYVKLLLTDEGQKLIEETGYIPRRTFLNHNYSSSK